MPAVPAALANLPAAARIDCPGPSQGGTVWRLWELPGVQPDDPNSAYAGKRGRVVELAPCTEVRMLQYAWPGIDREFYVLVEANQSRGWIPMHGLTLPSS